MSMAPIVLSVGEPAGIGPDLLVQLAQVPHSRKLIAVADPDLLVERAKQLGLPLALNDDPNDLAALGIVPIKLRARVRPGKLDPMNAEYVLQGISVAANMCLQQQAAAMVTAPVHKGVINAAGFPFSGHTEYLAALSHTPQVVMLLSGQHLKVALVTTHIPLKSVPVHLTPVLLERTLRILQQDLQQKFAMTKPRIGICALNPHAGEGGHMGREEIDLMLPIIQALRQEGMDLSDPLPADTLFNIKIRSQFDVILAMYHDQGLAPFKALEFGEGVNVTLGLPFIRTSVDHGTALDLAGTGRAEVSSLVAATQLAIDLANRKH